MGKVADRHRLKQSCAFGHVIDRVQHNVSIVRNSDTSRQQLNLTLRLSTLLTDKIRQHVGSGIYHADCTDSNDVITFDVLGVVSRTQRV